MKWTLLAVRDLGNLWLNLCLVFFPTGCQKQGDRAQGADTQLSACPAPHYGKRTTTLHKWQGIVRRLKGLVLPPLSLSPAPNTKITSFATLVIYWWIPLGWANCGSNTPGAVTTLPTRPCVFFLTLPLRQEPLPICLRNNLLTCRKTSNF